MLQVWLVVTPLIAYLAAILTVFTGLLMISNYRYFSFKEMHFTGTVPYMVFVFAVVLLVVVAQNPHEVLLTMSVIYAASGPTAWLFRKRTVVKKLDVAEKQAKSRKQGKSKKKQPAKTSRRGGTR